MPSTSPLQASGLSSYLSQMLSTARQTQADKATNAKSTTTTTSTSSAAATSTAKATRASVKPGADSASSIISSSTRMQIAQAGLDKRQRALATELQGLLAKAGSKLTGTLEFSVDAQGAVAVKGSAADSAALGAALKADKTQPSLSTRLTVLAKDAQALSDSLSQQTMMMRAARASTGSSNLMAVYESMLKQAPAPATAASSAVLSVWQGGSSLSYPGALQAQA